MSSTLFQIQEHVVSCQHIREYPRATADGQDEILELHVKQYTPLDNPNPRPGDITIIGAHANGFPKVRLQQGWCIVDKFPDLMQELYEPLWDEISNRSKSLGFRIRGIWIADVANQGMSSVLNEAKLGNDREALKAVQMEA